MNFLNYAAAATADEWINEAKKNVNISCATAISDGELIWNWNKKNMRQIRESHQK